MADGGAVTENDLRRLSNCILHLNATPPDAPGFVPRVLGLLGRLVESDSTFYGITDIPAKRTLVGLAIPQDLVTPEHAATFDRHFDDHPFHVGSSSPRPGRAFRLSDRVPSRTWRRTGLYNDFFAPAGMEYQVLVRLPGLPRHAHAIGAARSSHNFSTKDEVLLQAFYSHVRLAFAKGRRLSNLPDAPERTPRVKQVEVDDSGRVLSMPPGCDAKVISAYASQRTVTLGDVLPLSVVEWLRRGVAESASLSPNPHHGVLRLRGKHRVLECQLVPDPDHNRHLIQYFELEKGDNLVPPTPGQGARHRAIADAIRNWNLNTRQAAVLEFVILGETNKDIARRLGCAEVTVEFYLTALFRRAHVSRRSELIGRVLTSDQVES